MNEGICKSCGAPIIWALTDRGKRMPLSKATERRAFTLDFTADVNGGFTRSVVVYDSHFSDCPNANEHRHEPDPPAAPARSVTPETLDGGRA